MRGVYADGNRIKSVRQSMGLTQEAMAVIAGCDVKTARKAERNGRVDVYSLSRLAAVLKVEFSDLVATSPAAKNMAAINEQTIRTWEEAHLAQDIPAALDTFHSDARLLWFGATALGPSNHDGRGAIELHKRRFYESMIAHRSPIEVRSSGEYVYMRGLANLQLLACDQHVQCSFLQEFRMQRGKIIELTVFSGQLGE